MQLTGANVASTTSRSEHRDGRAIEKMVGRHVEKISDNRVLILNYSISLLLELPRSNMNYTFYGYTRTYLT